MFSFFKKRSKDLVQLRKHSSNSDEDTNTQQNLDNQNKSITLNSSKLNSVSSGNTTQASSGANSQSSSPSMPQLSHNSSSAQQSIPAQQKIFIEYTVQKDESLDDICEKFNMDKAFLMELNQIWTDDDIPLVVVVQATPILQQIIMNHAIKDETIQIIEKNTNLQVDGLNNSDSNDQKEIDEENKKIAFFSSLEKNEEFPMRLVTANGIIKGTLIINSFMAHFSPETKDFKRLQNEIELLKKQKAYKHHKFENNQLTDYSLILDINDIFMADINVIEQLPTLQASNNSSSSSSKSSKPQSKKSAQTSNQNTQNMEVKLDIFLSRAQGFTGDSSNKQFLKVEFISTETFKSNDESDSENIGRTYVHYVLQKLQYLIGKNRSNNEAINNYTDNFTQQPSQSVLKHFQIVSCNSLQLMNLDADSLFTTELNNPPRLQIYPTLLDGTTKTDSPSESFSSNVPSQLSYKRILNQSQFEQIVDRLPCYLQLNDWNLVYSPIKHGFSYEQMLKKTQNIGPHVIVVRDSKHKYVFGAFVTEGWTKTLATYGSAESFLYSFKKNPENYQRKYQNILWYRNRDGSNQIQHCNDTGIAIGIDTKFALFIHHSLSKGTTHSTRLMQNDLLTESNDFRIEDFEIWGLDPSKLPSKYNYA